MRKRLRYISKKFVLFLLLFQFLNVSLICTQQFHSGKSGHRHKINFSSTSVKKILEVILVDLLSNDTDGCTDFSNEEILENFELSCNGSSPIFKIQLNFTGPINAIIKLGINNYLPELTSPPPKQS